VLAELEALAIGSGPVSGCASRPAIHNREALALYRRARIHRARTVRRLRVGPLSVFMKSV